MRKHSTADLLILLWSAEPFLHCAVDLTWEAGIDAVEEIFETSFVRVVAEIDELFELFLKAVAQEAVMDPGYSRNVDTIDTKEFHLLWIEAGSDEIYTGGEPFICRLPFLETDVAACLKLGHQPMNILL